MTWARGSPCTCSPNPTLSGEAYDQALFELSREITVGGYPALEERLDQEASFSCEVTVGLADRQGMRVNYGRVLPPHDGFCEMAAVVAESIVVNLRAGR